MDSIFGIYPTASVHPSAVIGDGTEIGAHSMIGENMVIGKNCRLQENVILRARTTLGDEVKIFPHAVIGSEPAFALPGRADYTVVGKPMVI